jgi:hypothetical protein
MSDVEIFTSSPQLTTPKVIKHKYPWNELECGQSFAIPKDKIKLSTLRPMATAKGKRWNKKFKVIEHADVYEVGRVE